MTHKLKIIFMGTPDFACGALAKLNEDSPHEIIALYTQPPRPKGRGHKEQCSQTHDYANQHNIPVFTPRSLRKPEAQQAFAALNADIAIVAAYGLILPQVILDTPRYGCLNIHASLLPRWRGASPIQRAIWAGDLETGITIMQMDAGLDTGSMIAKQSTPITPETTCTQLHDELRAISSDLILSVLDDLAAKGTLNSTPQDNAQSSNAPLLTKEDGRINWSQSAKEIVQQVRALNPWPGTWTLYNDARLKILSSTLIEESKDAPSAKPGTLLNKQGHIQCRNSTILKLDQIQPAGKKAMDIASAINGGYIHINEPLE